MTERRIDRADRPAARADALDIRFRVFVDEQGVPRSLEVDDHEDEAVHLLAVEGTRPVGTARLRPYEGDADGKVERVAVLPDARGRGVGTELMAAAEAAARAEGFGELVLDAQVDVVGFYERLGWTPEGEPFDDAGIPHRRMRKRLEPG